jgi:hypothetical protein
VLQSYFQICIQLTLDSLVKSFFLCNNINFKKLKCVLVKISDRKQFYRFEYRISCVNSQMWIVFYRFLYRKLLPRCYSFFYFWCWSRHLFDISAILYFQGTWLYIGCLEICELKYCSKKVLKKLSKVVVLLHINFYVSNSSF